MRFFVFLYKECVVFFCEFMDTFYLIIFIGYDGREAFDYLMDMICLCMVCMFLEIVFKGRGVISYV